MSGFPCKDCGVFGHYDGPICNSCIHFNRIVELVTAIKKHKNDTEANIIDGNINVRDKELWKVLTTKESK